MIVDFPRQDSRRTLPRRWLLGSGPNLSGNCPGSTRDDRATHDHVERSAGSSNDPRAAIEKLRMNIMSSTKSVHPATVAPFGEVPERGDSGVTLSPSGLRSSSGGRETAFAGSRVWIPLKKPQSWLNLPCETQHQPRSRRDAVGTHSILCVSFVPFASLRLIRCPADPIESLPRLFIAIELDARYRTQRCARAAPRHLLAWSTGNLPGVESLEGGRLP
jgi:hypothetical protein